MSIDSACILIVSGKKEAVEESEEDCLSTIGIQEREEDLEGTSTDYHDNGRCEGKKEV